MTALEKFEFACAASKTPLVIFPAHNEKKGGAAAKAYPDLPCLDWKGEIDALIATGVPESDFCINDAHLHSTPLAGYVGAHMIYRAVYGEIPSPGNYAELAAKLGNYATTGKTPAVTAPICYLD